EVTRRPRTACEPPRAWKREGEPVSPAPPSLARRPPLAAVALPLQRGPEVEAVVAAAGAGGGGAQGPAGAALAQHPLLVDEDGAAAAGARAAGGGMGYTGHAGPPS